jgi:hypothetical protein
MQYFMTALVTYLACDGAATQRMLSQDEALHCARSYETVKVSFLSETEQRELSEGLAERSAVLLKGYWRFRDWMARHPDKVRRLRESAHAIQGGTGS